MNTPKPESRLEAALAAVPEKFRSKVLESYLALKRRTNLCDFEPAGLSAGKFCEAALRTLQNALTRTSAPFNKSIGNFADECRKLIQLPETSGPESLRVIVPRALVFLYTMRNKRSIGHVGGDVDPNAIDAATIMRTADWILCELIRCFHNLPIEEAQDLIDSVSVRQLPDVWEVDGRKRVLRVDIGTKEKVLLLLYSCQEGGAFEEDLCEWCRYSKLSMFKVRVLKPLDELNMLDFNEGTGWVTLSPIGHMRAEELIQRSKS
jgi:hypothetical protein